MIWLTIRTLVRAPLRLLLATLAAAFPVGVTGATLMFVDDSLRSMSRVTLSAVQVEMRAVATTLDIDIRDANRRLAAVEPISTADVFGSADVMVTPDNGTPVPARVFAVEPDYVGHHPWVRLTGPISTGAYLNVALQDEPGFKGSAQITIGPRPTASAVTGATTAGATAPDPDEQPDPSDPTPPPPTAAPATPPAPPVSVPFAGTADLRDATTWFAIPTGGVQGDLAVVPRVIVVDFATFERLLPSLRSALGTTSSVANPGLTDLPPVTLEAHVRVPHDEYPADPSRAATYSARLRRVLERTVPGSVIVADNALEPLQEAGIDANNAKTLFLLLGVPGVLVAGALGLAAAAALAEGHRREAALLRLRGATENQLLRQTIAHGAVATIAGIVVGLVVAGACVGAVIGHPVWRDVPGSSFVRTALIASAAGLLSTAARLVWLARAARRADLAGERNQMTESWTPVWMRGRLDLVFLLIGATILALNAASGGLRPSFTEEQLSFYVLLGPLFFWVGAVLLATRVGVRLLGRVTKPETARPLSSWWRTSVRWLGRRPARLAATAALGALAVSFGSEVTTFVATYHDAKHTDAVAAFGADLRVTPLVETLPAPKPGEGIASVTPLRPIPARAGSDRKTIMAVDLQTYGQTTALQPRITKGEGLGALSRDPTATLVAEEVVKDFDVQPGDTLPVTLFPDDPAAARKVDLRVAGVYRAFAPTDPISEMVVSTALVAQTLPLPEDYLVRVTPGRDPNLVATGIRARDPDRYTVTTLEQRVAHEQRGLTTLNLGGLSQIETAVAALVAAVGVGVLGAFVVLERRREHAILRMVGAASGAVSTAAIVEGALAVLGSLIVGLPLGVGMAIISVRVLGLFFFLPPPLVTIPWSDLAQLAGLVIGASALAMLVVAVRVARQEVSPVLREP